MRCTALLNLLTTKSSLSILNRLSLFSAAWRNWTGNLWFMSMGSGNGTWVGYLVNHKLLIYGLVKPQILQNSWPLEQQACALCRKEDPGHSLSTLDLSQPYLSLWNARISNVVSNVWYSWKPLICGSKAHILAYADLLAWQLSVCTCRQSSNGSCFTGVSPFLL